MKNTDLKTDFDFLNNKNIDTKESKSNSFWKKAKKIMKNVVQASTLVLWMTPAQTSALKSTPELNSINDLSIMQNITSDQKKFNDEFLKIVWAETPKLETKVIVESKDNLPKNFNITHEEILGLTWYTYAELDWSYSVVIDDNEVDYLSKKIWVDKKLYRESYVISNEIWSINYEKFLIEKWYIKPQVNYQVKDKLLNINLPYSNNLLSKNIKENILLKYEETKELSSFETRKLSEIAWDLNSIKSLLSNLDWKSVDPMILTLDMMNSKIVAKDAKQYDLIRDINSVAFKQAFWLDYTSQNLEDIFYSLNDIKNSKRFWADILYYENAFSYYQELFEKHFYAEVAKISENQADELIAANIFKDKINSDKTNNSNNWQIVDYIIKKSNNSQNLGTESSTNWPIIDYLDESKSNDSIIDALTKPNKHTFDFIDRNFKQDFSV